MSRTVEAIVDDATRGLPPYWTVSNVDASNKKVKLRYKAGATETCWVRYEAGLTLAIGDRVTFQGRDFKTGVVVGKL